jgi:hypothetical protein
MPGETDMIIRAEVHLNLLQDGFRRGATIFASTKMLP